MGFVFRRTIRLDLYVLSGPSGLPLLLRQRGFQLEARYRVQLSTTATFVRLDAGDLSVTFNKALSETLTETNNGRYFSGVY